MRSVLLLSPCLCFLFSCSPSVAWPAVAPGSEDKFPGLKLELDPPAQVTSQVSSLISTHEVQDERREQDGLLRLQMIMRAELGAVASKVGAVTARVLSTMDDPSAMSRPVSFLALPSLLGNDGAKGSKRTVRVKLVGQEPRVPKSFAAELATLEAARDSNWEADMKSVEARLRTLGDFVARELESELRAQMFRITAVRRAGRAGGKAAAFLARRTETPSQVNIEMGQQPYPTMSSLVKDMQMRRDLREDVNREVILDSELDFLEGANKIATAALSAAAARVRSLYK